MIEGNTIDNPLYKKLQAVVERYRQTGIGNKAPDFSLISTKNDTLSLETFKDKYLLLTFESSGCANCKGDYAALADIKKKFPKTQLEILTVALDENPVRWDSVAKSEKINWHQVIDSRGPASDLYLSYNIGNLPGHVLLDKEGLILAKDISTDSIQTLLNEYMKQKK
jgi:peroxiredoxin